MSTYAQAFAPAPAFRVTAPTWSFKTLLTLVRQWAAVARQRRQLAAMSDSQLSDIGLIRTDANKEARRPFHDLPASQFPRR